MAKKASLQLPLRVHNGFQSIRQPFQTPRFLFRCACSGVTPGAQNQSGTR
jgi:hypothetical protein